MDFFATVVIAIKARLADKLIRFEFQEEIIKDIARIKFRSNAGPWMKLCTVFVTNYPLKKKQEYFVYFSNNTYCIVLPRNKENESQLRLRIAYNAARKVDPKMITTISRNYARWRAIERITCIIHALLTSREYQLLK